MRILLLGPSLKQKRNISWELFRKDLGRFHDVIYYGDGYTAGYNSKISIPEVLNKYQNPDVILLHLTCSYHFLAGLETISKIPKILILGDYSPGRREEYRSDEFMKKYKFDMVFCDQGQIRERVRNKGLCASTEFLHYSIDTDFFYNMNFLREFDVMATFASNEDIYPMRRKVREILHAENRIKSFLDKAIHEKYAEYINKSKMFISTKSAYTENVLWKFQESMACGTMLLTTMPNNIDEYGYEVNKHFIVFDDISDMVDKILYYKDKIDERLDIAKNGMEFVRKNYSNEAVIARITERIKDFFNIKD